MREVVERLRSRLRTYRDERGRELFDVPDMPLPASDIPAPPRFLQTYDNVLLGHADRTRIVAEVDRKRLFTTNGVGHGTVLLDGFVAAIWRIIREADSATLDVQPFVRLAKADQAVIEEEENALLAFAAPEVAHDVRMIKPA